MNFFVVTNKHGPAWVGSRQMTEQEGWAEHAVFMNRLTDEGFVVLGGPLGDGSRAMLVVKADSENIIKTRLAADPWIPLGLLQIDTIEPWGILLGNERFERT